MAGGATKARQRLSKLARAGEDERRRKIGGAPSFCRKAWRSLVFPERVNFGGRLGQLLDRRFTANHANISFVISLLLEML